MATKENMVRRKDIDGVGRQQFISIHFHHYKFGTIEGREVVIPVYNPSRSSTKIEQNQMTGRDILYSLYNLYDEMNKPDCPYTNQEMIRDWCVLNMHPYHLQGLHYLMKEAGEPYKEGIERYGTIDVGDFIKSLGALYNQFRFYLALEELKRGKGEIAYNLSNEGRLSAGYPYFNIYKHNDDPVDSDDNNNQTGKSKSLPSDFNRVFVKRVKRDIEDLEDLLIGGFPNYTMTVHRIPGSNKIGFLAEVNSVFEVAWYALARLVVMDEEEVDANSLVRPRICKACGRIMNVEGSRQEYCLSSECQRVRKRKNRQDCDARKRQAEQED